MNLDVCENIPFNMYKDFVTDPAQVASGLPFMNLFIPNGAVEGATFVVIAELVAQLSPAMQGVIANSGTPIS